MNVAGVILHETALMAKHMKSDGSSVLVYTPECGPCGDVITPVLAVVQRSNSAGWVGIVHAAGKFFHVAERQQA
jgi:hypothetical protein